MTIEDKDPGAGTSASRDRLNANIAKMEELTQRFLAAISARRPSDPSLFAPSPEVVMRASGAYWAEFMRDPGKMLEHQVGYWGKALQHYVEAQHQFVKGQLVPPSDRTPRDRRFSNPLWETHPWFNYIKQQYLMSAEALEAGLDRLEQLDERERRRVTYFTRQIIDLMSPTNFLGTNPDALEKAVATDGESLVRGLENLVRDVERGGGEFLVSLADHNAFRVGDNIATATGSVVFRNRMLELIQYAPTTETAHRTPLIIFPPWINKFYILDLKPQNSFIRWVVDQGYTLFVVSWVNPDQSYADVGLDTYVTEGYLAAIEEVKRLTGEDEINAIGYCIAGTMLSLTLALLARRGDTSVKSATFLTTLTDFSDQGEFTPFLDDDFVNGIEREVKENGILHSFFMSRTFSFLRANDLIYTPAIRNYMLGEPPPAFDLLYWNGDGTNLPARMAIEYLRWLCQENRLAQDGIELLGERLTIADVTLPLCAVACETDHIAAWKASYEGIRKMGSRDKTFILSESGHIAGIVNPPSKGKYGHYTSAGPLGDAESWLRDAEFTPGSWWPRWEEWLAARSGPLIPAREPAEILDPAPGRYVVATVAA